MPRKRRVKLPEGVVPVDLDTVQDQPTDPQAEYDAWRREQDRSWKSIIKVWGEAK